MKKKVKINLKVKLAVLTLDNPVVCAYGSFGFGEELRGLVNFKNIGAIITKTITLLPRAGNPPPRIYETGCGVMNSVGLENPGLDGVIKEKLPLLQKLPTSCIVSVGGFTSEEYQGIVEELEGKRGIDGYEINLSCPNLRLKRMISQSEAATYKLTKALRKLTKRPLFIKISPEVTDIVKTAYAVEAGGADAVSLVNTFLSMAIDIETQKPFLGSIYGGYSGRAIKPLSLYRVWRVAQNIKIPVIGGGGIESTSDAIEFILAGAIAISLGTVNLAFPNQASQIVEGIKKYMKRENITDINKLRGKVDA
ncbi:MAG: dihydroorotate dehydrogenase [Candidatus Omnitrophota bacterium]|nr:MAG: dihydroorotate dehydrogenase [Candidatus Omnitrophota bacterium]